MFSRILWVAEGLLSQQPFHDGFYRVMNRIGIRYGCLPGVTHNIWCRDYMPVPTAQGHLVQFRYWPDYLVRSPKYRPTIVDAATVVVEHSVPRVHSDLIVDGGNVVLGPGYAVLTRKVLRENPHYTRRRLIAELEHLLGVDRIVLIPDDPHDFTGHADGMVCAYTNDTVLLNDYRHTDPELGARVRRALREAGLRHELVPYAPQGGTALGCYINFLRHLQGVVVPLYGLPEDGPALRRFAELFPWHEVRGLDCRTIALQGGSLHCITWATAPEWCQFNPRIQPKPDPDPA